MHQRKSHFNSCNEERVASYHPDVLGVWVMFAGHEEDLDSLNDLKTAEGTHPQVEKHPKQDSDGDLT